MKTALIKNNPIIIAAVSSKYFPKNQYVSFSAVSDNGHALFGYIDKSNGMITIISPNGGEQYITGSFSYISA